MKRPFAFVVLSLFAITLLLAGCKTLDHSKDVKPVSSAF